MYTHSHITHNSLPLHFSHIFCSLLNYQQCCTVYGTRHYVPIMYTLCTPLRQVHNITHTHTLTTNHTDGVNATARLQPSNRKQPVSRAVYTHMHTTISTAHTHTHSPLDTARTHCKRGCFWQSLATATATATPTATDVCMRWQMNLI